MGFSQNYFGNDEGKKSEFNAAALQMERIHRLQDLINMCSFNLLQYNPELREFNYIIKFRCLNQLYNESYPKATDKEKRKINRIKRLFKAAKEALPVIKKQPDSGFSMKEVVDKSNYEEIEELLDSYEKSVRELLDRSEMNSPNQERASGFDI